MDPGSWLEEALDRVSTARVAVFGDFALDAYWELAEADGETSIETGHAVRKVQSQRYGLGGAGNVAANLAALGISELRAIGLVGEDLFGAELQKRLTEIGAGHRGVLPCSGWQTPVFAKPHEHGVEQSRIDFGAFNEVDASRIDELVGLIDEAARTADIVVVNQQIPQGITTPPLIARLDNVIQSHPVGRFLVDSRHRPDRFPGAMLKMNADEARRVQAAGVGLEGTVRGLAERVGQAVFVTDGPRGIYTAHAGEVWHEPAVSITSPTDTVGAGDAALAAIAAALAGGAHPRDAGRLANLAAAVTVTKLQTTGTATPAEIRTLGGISRS